MKIWGQCIPDRGISKWKGPGAEAARYVYIMTRMPMWGEVSARTKSHESLRWLELNLSRKLR